MSIPLYVDIRSLQDPNYSFRGVGHHSAGILKYAKKLIPEVSEVVGIIDTGLDSLPEEYAQLVDRVQTEFNPPPNLNRGLFLELSPMTHDLTKAIRFLTNPNILCVTLIYDFIPLDFDTPRYLPNLDAINRYKTAINLLSNFDLFISISEYSNSRLQYYCNVNPLDCRVSGVAIRESVGCDFSQVNPRQDVASLIKKNYFFSVLGGDSRKNPKIVLKAHALYNLRSSSPTDLVILGYYPPASVQELQNYYLENKGNVQHLHIISKLTDREIGLLNYHAISGISPSFIEGFSIPVVEAARCGSPVLVSDIDAHRELIEQPDARFDPNDAEALFRLMTKIANEADFRNSLVNVQSPVWQRFTEDKVAKRTWEFIRSRLLVRGTPYILSTKHRFPRVAFLTPYPPEHSGVADYTAQSLAEISKYAKIDVFTTCKQPRQDPWVNQFYPISSAPYASGEYDLILPVIGNSYFHTRAIELHRQFGGPVLIHDNRLAELYAWWRGIDKFRIMVEAQTKKKYTNEECRSWLSQPWRLPSLYFEELIEQANPVIFHSKGIQRHVRQMYRKESAYLPFCCYRSFGDSELTESHRKSVRNKLCLGSDRIVISTFGIVDPSKGPIDCIWAVEFLRSWGIPVDLHFVGQSWHVLPQFMPLVQELKLEKHIHFQSDWISNQQYRDYIIASDYGIQLRTHGFGGLSGAMLDCIGSGLPTVANEDLAEAMDSPSYVLRVPDNFSPVLMAEQLYNAIQQGLHLDRLKPERLKYVRDHSFQRYAKEFVKLLLLD